MKRLTQLVLPLALATTLGAKDAQAQWATASAYANPTSSFLRLEFGTRMAVLPINYAFIDKTTKGHFGQVQSSIPLYSNKQTGAALTIGGEYETVSDAPDAFRPQIGYTIIKGTAQLDIRVAPVQFGAPNKRQFSVAAGIDLPRVGGRISGWGDLEPAPYGQKDFGIGEIQYARSVGKGFKAAVLAQMNSASGATYKLGAQKDFSLPH